MYLVIQNFLTYEYQKKKKWKNFDSNIFTPPPTKVGEKIEKLVLEPKLQKMIPYIHNDKKKSKRWAPYLKNGSFMIFSKNIS